MTVVLGVLGITLIAGGSAYAYTNSQAKQQLEAAQTEVTNQEAALKTLNSDLKGYFDQKSPSFLVENMQESQITDLKNKVKKATTPTETTQKVDFSTFNQEAAEVETTMTTLETTFNQQQAVNQLFVGTAVNGAKVSKELAIANDLKKETVDQIKKTVEKQTTDFEKAIKELATEAENQLKQLDQAKQATEKVYKDDKVISTDTNLYDSAKTEVDKIKNDKSKKDLQSKLDKVKADIDKKAKEAADKAKQNDEQKAAQESQTKANEQEQANVADNSAANGGNTQGDNAGAANNDYSVSDAGTNAANNGNSGYVPPTTGNGGNNGSTGGGQTQPPATGGNGSGNGGSSGGGTTAPPAGTVGPFYSEDECWAYAESQGWSGFAVTIIDGAMYISPR